MVATIWTMNPSRPGSPVVSTATPQGRQLHGHILRRKVAGQAEDHRREIVARPVVRFRGTWLYLLIRLVRRAPQGVVHMGGGCRGGMADSRRGAGEDSDVDGGGDDVGESQGNAGAGSPRRSPAGSGIDRLSDALFRYGRALTWIYDLTLHSRSRATSTFYDDLADLLFQTADEDRIQRDHRLPDLPNAEAYPIDYRMEGKSGGQVFLYGVPNRDKARLTTIILSHFHRNHLDFDSILVFSNQADILRMDLARLSDVGGDMVSSLASREDASSSMRRVTQFACASKTDTPPRTRYSSLGFPAEPESSR